MQAIACNCQENFDGNRSYRILIADGPREPYSQEELSDPIDERLSKEERKLATLRRLGQTGELIERKRTNKIASLDIPGIQEIHYPGDMVRSCHCIVPLDKSAISDVEARLNDAGYGIKGK